MTKPQFDPAALPIRTLIVDDSAVARRAIAALLRVQKGVFTVVGEAENCQEAVDLARTLRPDLILMDFRLPDYSGIEATVHILRERPDAKIIIVTSVESPTLEQAALAHGAQALVGKLQIRSELMNAVARIFPG